MEQAYWLKRELASLKLAQKAGGSKAGLVQFELAGRYSIKAVRAGIAASALEAPVPQETHTNSTATTDADDV